MTALAIGFDVPFDEAIKAAVTRGVVLPDVYYGELQGVAHQLAFSIAGIAAYDQLQAVRDSLASAIADGKSFREWKRTIPSELFELPNYRLENIWRTNLQGNYMRGRWERFTRFAKNRPFLMYDAINDTRVRPSHLAHDGVIRAVHDRFWATHSPPLGYNKILPGAEVMANTEVGLKGFYSGPAIEIVGHSPGVRLSVTAYHPVLTGRGWVFAKDIQVGDEIFTYGPEVCGGVSGHANEDNSPSLIEDVFEALLAAGHCSMPATSFNLYGDQHLIDGNIEVVTSNRELMNWMVAKREEVSAYIDFASSLVAFCKRAGPGGFKRHLLRSPGLVSISAGHFCDVLNTVLPDLGLDHRSGYAKLLQPMQESLAAYAVSLGNFAAVESADVVRDRALRYRTLQVRAAAAAKLVTNNLRGLCSGPRDPSFTDVFVGGFGVNPEAHRDLLERFPGKIVSDHVVSARWFDFSGHCYDLQTKNGLILARHGNGRFMVVSNCRCTLVSLTEAQAQARSGPGKGLYQIPEHADGKPAMPDPGWDFNPFEDRMRFIDGQIRKREADPKSNRKLVSSLQGLKPPKPWLDDAAGRWHDAACQNAPEWLTRNFSKHASPDVWQTRGASAYCRWEKELEMGDTRMDTPGGQNTWRHEFGHWLDGKMRTNNGGRFYRSEAPDFVHAMKEDAMLARGKVGAGTRAANVRAKLDALYLEGRETMERMAFDKEWIITHLEDRYRALGLEISDALDALAEEMPVAFMGRAVHDVFIATMLNGIAIAMENSDAHGFWETFARDNRYVYKDMIGGKLHSLSDLIGSATLNGVLGIKHAGIGHSDAYYKKSSAKAGTECFANLTALYGAGHPFWSKVAERFAPGMSKLYNTIMKQ